MDLSTHSHSLNFRSSELSLHGENLMGLQCPGARVRQASGLTS